MARYVKVDSSDAIRRINELDMEIPEAAAEGIELGAAAIRDEAKRRARVKTGNMRDHIGYYTKGSPTKEAVIESTVFYAAWQEFGTRYITPNYYLTGAIEMIAPQLPEKVASAIRGKVTEGKGGNYRVI